MNVEHRKPTYGSAIRMAELLLILTKTWRPMSVHQLCDRLGVSYRTIQRYRKVLNENLTAGDRGEFLKVIKEGEAEQWYLADQEEIINVTFFRLTCLYVAMALLQPLEGTVLLEGMKHISSAVTGKLKPSKRTQVELFDKKIRYSGFGRKSYAKDNTVLSEILKGLINETKLEISHYSLRASKQKSHIIRPYTLLLHKDTLYLHAFVEDYGQIRTFSLDRIQNAINREESFRYPHKYNPEKLTDGSFGIYETPGRQPFKVVVSIDNSLWEYMTTRRWHSSQQFCSSKNGTFTMELYLTNTKELTSWILQFGSCVEVLEPHWLREEIRVILNATLQKYL